MVYKEAADLGYAGNFLFVNYLRQLISSNRDFKKIDTEKNVQKREDKCETVPKIWSSFIDAFVDFSVGGHVLNSDLSPHPTASKDQDVPYPPNPIVTFLPAAERVIAIGDIHGDIKKARHALRIAGLVDEKDNWTGDSTVLVQVGDQLDRGGDEIKVLYLFEKLRREASRAGGAVHILHGNHETGNIEGWFRYATKEGLKEFDRWSTWQQIGSSLKNACHGNPKTVGPLFNVPDHIPGLYRTRHAALSPGGPIATRFLASHPTVLIIGSSVFVHGGLLPEHVEYGLDKINSEVREWVLGRNATNLTENRRSNAPYYLHGRNAVVWLRKYSEENEEKCDCRLLNRTLGLIPEARRMIVGHTIQTQGINAICGGQVFRTDVGMSTGCYDAAPQVLEILKDKLVRILRADSEPRVLPPEPTPNLNFVVNVKEN